MMKKYTSNKKEIKKLSKQLSRLYKLHSENEYTHSVDMNDLKDEKLWKSNGGKHPYRGQDLMENFILGKTLRNEILQADSHDLMEMCKRSSSLADFINKMEEKHFYVIVGGLECWHFGRVGSTGFWNHITDKMMSRATLVEHIIDKHQIERNLGNIEAVTEYMQEYDQYVASQPVSENAREYSVARDKLFEQLFLLKSGGLSWDDAQKQLEHMSMSSSSQEHKGKMNRGNTDQRTAYGDDLFLQRRNALVKEDAFQMKTPDGLFSMLSMNATNFLIEKHPNCSPGDIGNCTGADPDAETKPEWWANVQRAATVCFKESLKCPGMFAVPGWWWSELFLQFDIRLSQYASRCMDEPYPTGKVDTVMSRSPSWIARTKQRSEKEFAKFVMDKHSMLHQMVSGQSYPEMVPFRTTFIHFEDELTSGRLIYQRALSQSGQVNQHMVPTSAYGPDGRLVPLDLIYCSGFFFREADEARPSSADRILGKKVIYGLYHGYVISREECPEGMDFIRIPIVCRIHVDGKWFPHGPGPDGRIPLQSVVIPVIDMMIDGLNNHRVVTTGFNKRQRRLKATSKKKTGVNVTPRRYSRMMMSAGSTTVPPIEDCPLMRLPKWKLSKRIKCRKHERCYIRDGRLPLDKEQHDLLLSRGYVVYKDNLEVGPRDAKRLKMRNVEWPDGYRWVAIRTIIVEEHEKGPEDEDLVPLILVPQAKVMKDSADFEMSKKLQGGE